MKYNKIIGLLAITTTIALTACTDDMMNILRGNNEIVFDINSSNSVTRSCDETVEIEPKELTAEDGSTYYLHTEISSMSDSVFQTASTSTRGATKDASNLQSDGFFVSAYNTTDGTTLGSSYFEYITPSWNSTSSVYTTGKYWPAGKLLFYAYYPKASASNGISQGANASTLTYTVPSTPANHPDLMTAKATNQQYVAETANSDRTSLTFNHALCAIKFQTGTDIAGGTINSITFNNVYTSGTYNLSNGTWSDTSTGNVSFTGLSKATTEGVSGTAILSDGNTLMMIPQTFGNTSSISLSLTDKYNVAYNLSFSLNGTSWTKGKIITYTITTKGIILDYYKRNPLWYCSKYNVKGTSANTFDTQENTNQGTSYYWEGAMSLYYGNTSSKGSYTVGNKTMTNPAADSENGLTFKYHIPISWEWTSIVPVHYAGVSGISMSMMPYDASTSTQYTDGKNHVIKEPYCLWGYNTTTKAAKQYESYFTPPISGGGYTKWYAIRFLGTSYCSVWYYNTNTWGGTDARLEIKSEIIQNITKTNTTALENIITALKNGTYEWSPHAITRKLYACGFGGNTSSIDKAYDNSQKTRILYLSSTLQGSGTNYYLNGQEGGDYMAVYSHATYFNLSLRPFRDN